MKTITTKFLAIGAAVVLVSSANAATINGSIEFVGSTATLNGSGTGVANWGSVDVLYTSGDFTGTSGAVTLATPWTFNSGMVTDFWTVGGFTFHLTSSSIVGTSPFVNVLGKGIVEGNGFEPTYGSWEFTKLKENGGRFSFLGGTVAEGEAVPDGGTTVALLGISLLGVFGVSKKLRRSGN